METKAISNEPCGRSGATDFAPPERLSSLEIEDLCQAVLDNEVVTAILEAVSGFAMVLSQTRQVIGINRSLGEMLELSNPVCFQGLRPGELFSCLHVESAPSGCGTGVSCRSCGAVLTILSAQATRQPAEDECSLLRSGEDGLTAVELKVRAAPLVVAGHNVVVLVLQDVSAAKRKDALERVFLHDLQNAVTGLVGLGELASERMSVDLVRQIAELAMEMGQGIRAQQLLLDAERGCLETHPTAHTGLKILAHLEEQLPRHRGRLSARSSNPDAKLTCDQQLLSRVLLNMATNALEAARPDEVVSVRHEVRDGAHVFAVHNEEPIPAQVSGRIFHRSFSTKAGSGRGLGTYGMKLLGEQYLRGKVWFESSEERGTNFYLSVPDS